MNRTLDCIPCMFRQTLEAARRITDDTDVHERELRRAAALFLDTDPGTSMPLIAQMIHRRMRGISGTADPYATDREMQNTIALSSLPAARKMMRNHRDPFEMAVRLAIAGNIIDMGAKTAIDAAEIFGTLKAAANEPLLGDLEQFRDSVTRATRILYLADNAGEIVFDRLLVEVIGPDRVTVAVRGGPVLNDAVMRDAIETGLDALTNVIDNGSDAPGTILDDCSIEFKAQYDQADLIISKGQGNFETLFNETAPIAFLFKVKCPVVSRLTGLSVGSHALIQKENP